jgi:hypothetical protein
MIAVVLEELQNAFLENLSLQDPEVFDTSSASTEDERRDLLLRLVRRRTERVLDNIPAAFFAAEWQTKSLNTGAGRDALQYTLDQLIRSAGTFQYARSTLVAGASN